jgi:Fe-S-cluster containining protein
MAKRSTRSTPPVAPYALIPTSDQAHHDAVLQRWEDLKARLPSVQANLELVDSPATRAEAEVFTHRALEAQNGSAKVQWLRQASDTLTRKVAPLSACRKGCNHCCHIPVTLAESEARVIAKETGARLATPRNSLDLAALYEQLEADDERAEMEFLRFEAEDQARNYGKPCPFLRGGSCSIYASRPLICRNLLNLDVDELLCKLVDSEDAASVPYFDMSRFKTIASQALMGPRLADIREWFPT